jgi:hypothetical protein
MFEVSTTWDLWGGRGGGVQCCLVFGTQIVILQVLQLWERPVATTTQLFVCACPRNWGAAYIMAECDPLVRAPRAAGGADMAFNMSVFLGGQ